MCQKQTLQLSQFLPYRLSVLSNTISQRIAETYQERFGLTMGQWRIMAILGEADRLTATQLCQRTAMDKVAVSRAVAGLVEADNVSRTPAESDARQAHLSLTEKGQAVYQQIVPHALSFEQDLLCHLSEDDVAALDQLLGQIAQAASPKADLW